MKNSTFPLDILLDEFNYPGKILAEQLFIDPSIISRWRRGTRHIPSEYVNQIVNIFMELDSVTEYSSIRNLLSYVWPKADAMTKPELKNHFIYWLKNTSSIQPDNSNLWRTIKQKASNSHHSTYLSYIGKEGRQEAILQLLDAAISLPNCELWLYTQEKPDWFSSYSSSSEFKNMWCKTNAALIQKGCITHVIYPADRTYNEMAHSLFSWLPFHLTGKVIAYYQPKRLVQDIQNTLFLIKDKLLLYGIFVNNISENSLSILAANPTILKEAYNAISYQFSYSHELFDSLHFGNYQLFNQYVSLMSKKEGNQYLLTSIPFCPFLEEEHLKKILSINNVDPDRQKACINTCNTIVEYEKKHINSFHRYLIQPAKLETLLTKDTVILEALSFHCGSIIEVPQLEFRNLLSALILKLQETDNYDICLFPGLPYSGFDNLNLLLKEDTNMVSYSMNNTNPEDPLSLICSKEDVVSSLYLYIEQLWLSLPNRNKDKNYVCNKILSMLK